MYGSTEESPEFILSINSLNPGLNISGALSIDFAIATGIV
jgi:hypothetical protein